MTKKNSPYQIEKNKHSATRTKGVNSFSSYRELKPEELRWNCPTKYFKFKTTEEIKSLDSIVGQPRAIEAIRLGAELFSKGYNIFVSGLSGTGRLTTVKKILEEVTTLTRVTYDYCYVNNFENPDQPRLIRLQKGSGRVFSKTIEDTISFLRRRLPKLFEEESFQASRRKIIEHYQKKEKEILDVFDKKIEPLGFIRGQLESEQGITQPEVFPVIDDKPVQIEKIEQLVAEGKITKRKASEIKKLYQQFHSEIYDLARKGMKLMQDFRNAIAENDKAASTHFVNTVFDEIKEKYKNPKVDIYIEEVKKYILENLNLFFPQDNGVAQIVENTAPMKEGEKFAVFAVNIILDNSFTDKAPVIIETTPSYSNLFGTIERVYDSRGFWRTDFTKIKAGSVLRADQGYIIVNALDLFTEPGVWPALKRVLLYDKLEIQPWEYYFGVSQSSIKPEPIDVNVKVIIIGGQTLYRLLYLYEKGFKKIFKINAQFDYETEKNEAMIYNIARFVAKICEKDNLPHCTPDGVAAIVEWAIEHAGSQKRISLKFSDIADIVREAAFYDRGSSRRYINREDVEKAIEWRRHRNDLLDEKIKIYILEGNIFIDTDGERVGQINGLTVYDTGILYFGKPTRITASISAGNLGIINIEREVEMSGAIHSKGVLIINGYLRERFAQLHPLSLTASIAFEQSYGGIDGDSASAAEIYILLSAIAEVPIKQNFAVTGSVNQKGDIQPIGGVNEKIRGFFEICRDRGLTGNQGVIIPAQNVNDLMLYKDIVDAVRKKMFHIYAIKSVEEGAEILMGLPVGKMRNDGTYPPDTLFGKVQNRLKELHDLANGKEDEKKKKKTRKKQIEREEVDE